MKEAGYLSKVKKFWTVKRKENMSGCIFVLPWIIGFCAFFLYPLFYSLVLAFSAVVDITSFTTRFVGFENFYSAMVNDVNFIPYLMESTGDMLINTPVILVFSFSIAILLNRELKFRGLFRAAFLLPVLLGTGAVMSALQGNSAGVGFSLGSEAEAAESVMSIKDIEISQQITLLLGHTAAEYLQSVLNKVTSILWMSGIQIIIFLGALQTIPFSLYEAAYCDGATQWEKFWKITLPLTTPTILLNAVYTMIDYFTNIENAVMKYVMDIAVGSFMLSYGSALGWIYFLFVGIVLLLLVWFMRRYSYDMN